MDTVASRRAWKQHCVCNSHSNTSGLVPISVLPRSALGNPDWACWRRTMGGFLSMKPN